MSDTTLDKSFALSGPIALHVRIAHGAVTVETADGITAATVHIETDKDGVEVLAETAVEMRGSTLAIVAPRQGGLFDLSLFGGKRTGRGLDVRVVIPTGSDVKIATFTAAIRIPGRVGDADLAFGSSEAAVREVNGDLRLRFGSGNAKAVEVKGSVQLRSGSGNSRIEAVHGDVDVVSGSGRLELGLPAGVSAKLEVHTGSGKVRSDLPIEDNPREATNTITVRARTGSGDVHLFRAA
jgi:hypothetical protein